MRLARRAFLASLVSSVAAPGIMRLARADTPQVTLKLHHSFSSVSGGHEKFLAPWARTVEAQSGGRIGIDIFPSMQLGGAPAELLDQARDGVADIVWAAPGNTPGRFAKIETFELPFLPSRRALVNSKALQDFANVNLRDEFRDVRPICFSCRDHGVLHNFRAIRTIADLRGLRLHVPNRLAGESVHALGGQGVTVPIPQLPMAVNGHAIEGCLVPWDAVPALRLQDLLKQHTDFAESTLSVSTYVLAMNNASYDRLPRELKAVIDDNSGLATAGMAGAMWDQEAKTVAEALRERGDPITMLTADEVLPWRHATEPVIAAWLKQMKERKVDGGKLIASVHALLGKYASEPEPQSEQPPQVQQQQAQQPQSKQPPESKIMAEPARPPQPPHLSQAPQPKPEITAMPKADAPSATPPVIRQRAPLKELDIPL
jgi:TRAP-type C4-dicarboxylate transport system substrate-binding protein